MSDTEWLCSAERKQKEEEEFKAAHEKYTSYFAIRPWCLMNDVKWMELLENCIDGGELLKDEYFRLHLTLISNSLQLIQSENKHAEDCAKAGLVNLIPHCSNNTVLYKFGCIFCTFKAQSTNLTNPSRFACRCLSVLLSHREGYFTQRIHCPVINNQTDCGNIPFSSAEKDLGIYKLKANQNLKLPECDENQDRVTNIDDLQCIVCFSNERTVTFLNCHHTAICITCAEKIPRNQGEYLKCLLCKEPVIGFVITHFRTTDA